MTEQQVVFICETCLEKNRTRHSRGERLVTDRFDSLTEAYEHLLSSLNQSGDGNIITHNITALVEKDN